MMWSRFAKPLCPPTRDYWCGSPPVFTILHTRIERPLGRHSAWTACSLALAQVSRGCFPVAIVWWCIGPLLVLILPFTATWRSCVNPDRYLLWTSDITKRVRVRTWRFCVARKMNSECFYLFKAGISFYIQSYPVQTIMKISDVSSTKMAIIKGWWYSKWIVIRPHIYLTSLTRDSLGWQSFCADIRRDVRFCTLNICLDALNLRHSHSTPPRSPR